MQVPKRAALFVFAVLLDATGAQAQAAGRPGADLDWPCHNPKVPDFPLASVWDGPAIVVDPPDWRDDPLVAALAAQMTARRVPVADVQAAVAKLQTAAGADAKAKIGTAFGAAFGALVRERAEILNGLDRFGRKQKDMADRIRAENETAHRPDATPDDPALQKLQWDLRVYDDRRRTISYVCEAPQAIEARIGELVKIVRPAL